jgi:hypothetical protein
MGNRILTLNIDEGYHNRNIINSVISDEGKKVTSEANGNHFKLLFISLKRRFLNITATNLSNSYSNDVLTVKLSGFPDMHWRSLFTSTRRQVAHYHLVFKHFLQKGPCNSTQFKNC